MRCFALMVVLATAGLVQPNVAEAQYPCNEMCVHFTGGSGQHLGYGCFAGTEGDGCVATYDSCSLTTGGCGNTEEEASAELAMGTDAIAQLFSRGFVQTAGGSLLYAVVPCKSGSGALFLPATLVSEEFDIDAMLGAGSNGEDSGELTREFTVRLLAGW